MNLSEVLTISFLIVLAFAIVALVLKGKKDIDDRDVKEDE